MFKRRRISYIRGGNGEEKLVSNLERANNACGNDPDRGDALKLFLIAGITMTPFKEFLISGMLTVRLHIFFFCILLFIHLSFV